jgi:hypothetical protein
MAIKPPVLKQFDDAKLQAMTEPLTVRVEKISHGRRTPIPLPPTEEEEAGPNGTGSGTGWDRESVRQIEQFLVTSWSGGGTYEITVTDAAGQVLKWTPAWAVDQYPEIIPPPLRSAVNPNPSPSARRTIMPPAFPNGFPQFPQPQFSGYAQQPMMPQPYYQMPPPPPFGTPAYAQWSHEAKDRQESAELRALREENARRERETIEARHRAELERVRQENEARFTKQDQSLEAMRQMIASLTTTMTQSIQAQQNAPKASSELDALKMQLADSQRRADEERHQREIERRERESREMFKQMQENSQRQIDAMARQLEQFQHALTATNQNKHDPLVEMLKEQARQSADAVKEISRNNTATMERLQTSMLSPRDILALAKESTAAADQVTEKLSNTFGRVIDLQTKVTENALSMQPQGSPIVDMVRDGAANLKEMGERYFGMQELNKKLEAERQAQLIDAQMQLAMQQQHQHQQAGLAGHQPQMPAQPQMPEGAISMPPPPSRRPGRKAADKQPKRLGRTDTEWFGPIEDNVKQLRDGVAEFLESIKTGTVDEEGNPIGLSPEQAAQGIAQAAMMVVQHQVNLPAMTDLLFPQRFGDFMDVLLPDAPEQYRADVVAILMPLLRGGVGGEEVGDEPAQAARQSEANEAEDSDEDEEPEDDAEEDLADTEDTKPGPARGLSVVPPTAAKPRPNGKPANPPRRA